MEIDVRRIQQTKLQDRVKVLTEALEFYRDAEYGGELWITGTDDFHNSDIAEKALAAGDRSDET